ncbi:MAG TPA: hypothetical protein VE911_05455 [Candidatus Nitrosopolaris sp.]|nr:hypothetical protein [Candidatus Nitrosopolaris sp.]
MCQRLRSGSPVLTVLTLLLIACPLLVPAEAAAVVFCAGRTPTKVKIRPGATCKRGETDMTGEVGSALCTCTVPTTTTTIPTDCGHLQPTFKTDFASDAELRSLLLGRWRNCGSPCCEPFGFALFAALEFRADGQWQAYNDDGAGGLVPDPFTFGPFTLVPPNTVGPSGIKTDVWTVALVAGTSLVTQADVAFSLSGGNMELTGAQGLGIIVDYVRTTP